MGQSGGANDQEPAASQSARAKEPALSRALLRASIASRPRCGGFKKYGWKLVKSWTHVARMDELHCHP